MAGRLEKEKKRKQRTESRLAQRTGKSTEEREFRKRLKQWLDGLKKKTGVRYHQKPFIGPDWDVKGLTSKEKRERKKQAEKYQANAKGGKLKKGGKTKKMRVYSKGGKAK